MSGPDTGPMKITVGLPDDADTPLLMIGPTERAAIAAAIAEARSRPPFTRETAAHSPVRVPFVEIPQGYGAGVSFEEHPGGLMIHLSVHMKKGGPPPLDAVEIIANEFGIEAGKCVDFWVGSVRDANLLAPAPAGGSA